MRYMLAALLALGIGIVAAVPAALAEGNNGARTCYVNGVASACVPNTPSPHQENIGQ